MQYSIRFSIRCMVYRTWCRILGSGIVSILCFRVQGVDLEFWGQLRVPVQIQAYEFPRCYIRKTLNRKP